MALQNCSKNWRARFQKKSNSQKSSKWTKKLDFQGSSAEKTVRSLVDGKKTPIVKVVQNSGNLVLDMPEKKAHNKTTVVKVVETRFSQLLPNKTMEKIVQQQRKNIKLQNTVSSLSMGKFRWLRFLHEEERDKSHENNTAGYHRHILRRPNLVKDAILEDENVVSSKRKKKFSSP